MERMSALALKRSPRRQPGADNRLLLGHFFRSLTLKRSVIARRLRIGSLLLVAAACIFSDCRANDQPFHSSAASDLSLTKQPPPDDAEHVAKLLKAISLPANIELRVTELQGLTARAVLLDQKRYIVYSRSFMDRVKNPIRDWAALGLFAHEVGHHLAGHTIFAQGSSRKTEMEADEWAGFILGYLGATEAEATNAVDNYAATIATLTHPSKSERRAAVVAGWENAKK